MKKETFILDGKDITLYKNYDGGKILYLGESHADSEQQDKIANRLKKLTGKKPWSLVIYSVDDWNNDLSPWKAPQSHGDESFGGNGENTLLWIKEKLIPLVEKDGEYEKRYIAGYSLSGLFSLWAFYESDIFDGAASCSGSLWFEGWDEYIKGKTAKEDSVVYLSLGIKEEKTKNPWMSLVGDRTREQLTICENDKNIIRTTLTMHPGGHFTEPENRTAEALAWLVNEEDNK